MHTRVVTGLPFAIPVVSTDIAGGSKVSCIWLGCSAVFSFSSAACPVCMVLAGRALGLYTAPY